MEHQTKETLFVRIGGMTAVNVAVDLFYQKLIADVRVSHFFRHIDMTKQSGKLKAFLAYALGAPMPYSGKTMKAAHAHMQITEEHFNAVAGHLDATLTELGVQRTLIDEVMQIAAQTKTDIISVPAEVMI